MARTYPDFIENAIIMDFGNFRRIGKDRWDTFEIEGYRKLSTVLQKSKDIPWGRLYVYYHDIYILIQYISGYNEKYNTVEEITEDEFDKVVQDNMDNPYINWEAIYYHINDNYRWRQEYLDHYENIVANVLFKYHKQLKQDNFWS